MSFTSCHLRSMASTSPAIRWVSGLDLACESCPSIRGNRRLGGSNQTLPTQIMIPGHLGHKNPRVSALFG